MGNIIDYVKWRGDLTFDVDPFNDVDNLCIAQAAYTELKGIIKKDEKVTMKELAVRYFKKHARKEVRNSKSFVADSPFLFELMGKSKRFGNALVSDYCAITSEKESMQFAAFKLTLDDGSTYIVFRGTDDTLVGWFEDLNMSHQVVPSQQMAIKYLNEVGKDVPMLRVGGHSKGGNLAEVAAGFADDAIKDNIIQVYSNDGPGIGRDIYKKTDKKILDEYYTKIIPENDFFGTIFDASICEKKVIKSSESSFLCHNAFTWLVEGNKFLTAKKTTAQSQSIRRGIAKFLNDTKPKQREKFTKELYQALTKVGIKNITDLAEGGISLIIKALISVSKMDPSSKDMANQLIKIIINSYGAEFNKFVSEQKKKLASMTKDVGKSIYKGLTGLEKQLYEKVIHNH